MTRLTTWLRGLSLLRHPDVVADLAARHQKIRELRALARQCPGAKIGMHVCLLGHQRGRLKLAPGATLCDGSILSFGDDRNGRGHIEIGEASWIGQYNNLRAGGGDIRIGRDCLISQFCSLVASNHSHRRGTPIQQQGSSADRTGVIIEDDVWLGVGCAVMPGVCIGEGAVIGANAVVTTNVPSHEIWGGVPARKIGERR